MKNPVRPARAASLPTGTMKATKPLVTPAAIRMSSMPMADRTARTTKAASASSSFQSPRRNRFWICGGTSI